MKDIEDEIPFAVPEGWVWCRLGEIADIARGGSPRPIEDFITDKENGINWIKIGDTTPEDKYIISAKEKIKPEGKKHSRFVHAGNFLLTNSMSFGRPYILKIDGCIHDGWLVFADIRKYLLKDFLYYALSSQYIYNSFSLVAAGSTVKNLKADTVKQVLFPLPPLAEQKRIVTAIEAIFTQIELLEQNKTNLQTAVKQAKSKILDLAIHGKLVPQDPADEPASVMLEKLRAEKETKIAAGEIKRSKNDSYIYRNPTDNCYYQKYTDGCEENISDEIPFDVPEGWVWCRLGEICTFKGGGTPDTSNPSYWNGSLNWASVKDIKGDFLYSTTDKITELGLKNSSGYLAKIDDIILITRIVPGKAIITKIETAINQDLKIILPKIEIEKQFLLYFFRQNEDDFVGKSSGTTVKGIKLEYITSKFIPIPPLAEQKRIVAKIEELFTKLDFITTTLTE